MKSRLLLAPVAAALSVAVASAAEPVKAPKAMPAVTASSNQSLADSVAAKIMGNANAQGADVSIVCVDGVVTLTGTCANSTQLEAIVKDVRTHTGVKMVRNGLSTASVLQAQATSGPLSIPTIAAQPPMAGGPVIEPAPLGGAGMGAMDMNAPPLPPYAWPTYAPQGNVSRVANPNAYPYNAFPFIGPYYPFPKVPLGWRTVQLKWEDGFWWYSRQSAPQDYWRVRFW